MKQVNVKQRTSRMEISYLGKRKPREPAELWSSSALDNPQGPQSRQRRRQRGELPIRHRRNWRWGRDNAPDRRVPKIAEACGAAAPEAACRREELDREVCLRDL